MSAEVIMRVQVEIVRCGGIAYCVRESSELFRIDEGSKRAQVLAEPVPPHLERAARRAAAACPYRALMVEEEGGTRATTGAGNEQHA
jgi:ferredoxin